MSKVNLKLEYQDKDGSVLKVFIKEIESSYTPHKSMVFHGDDYTFEARDIYFDLDDGTISVRFVESYVQEESAWDFLKTRGWQQL